MIKRGSSVDQVGLVPQTNVAPGDATTGMVPIALPDEPLPVNRSDGGSRESAVPAAGVTNCSPGAGKNFKANTGCDNP